MISLAGRVPQRAFADARPYPHHPEQSSYPDPGAGDTPQPGQCIRPGFIQQEYSQSAAERGRQHDIAQEPKIPGTPVNSVGGIGQDVNRLGNGRYNPGRLKARQSETAKRAKTWKSRWYWGPESTTTGGAGGLHFPARSGERQEDGSTLIVELATGCEAPGLYGKNKAIFHFESPLVFLELALIAAASIVF